MFSGDRLGQKPHVCGAGLSYALSPFFAPECKWLLCRRGERLHPGIFVEIQDAALRHSREWQVARLEVKEPLLLRLAHTCPE